MKLDTKQKSERTKQFLEHIKKAPNIQPFLYLEDLVRFGIHDFGYISPLYVTFSFIEKKLKEGKYTWLEDFVRDLRALFISVSDYAFENDQLQESCKQFIEKIDKFSAELIEQYGQTERPKRALLWVQPKKQDRDTDNSIITKEQKVELLSKLEMLFAFQKFENDPTSLRIMANYVGLGHHMSQDQFHIDVDIESSFMKEYFELEEE